MLLCLDMQRRSSALVLQNSACFHELSAGSGRADDDVGMVDLA
jgi:hypothetical protein